MTSRSKKSENAVEAEIIAFLQELAWRPQRNHVGVFRTEWGSRVSIGKKGYPDWTFYRRADKIGMVQLIHVEVKKPGEKPEKHQMEMIASLNYLGELTIWADSLEMFKAKYAQSFQDVKAA